MKKYHLILLLIILTLSSCRYSAPLVKFKQKSDTLYAKNKKTIKTDYTYFRISRYGIFGEFSKTRFFTNDILDSIRIKKHSTNVIMRDGVRTSSTKTKKYTYNDDSLRKPVIYEINYRYKRKQCKGVARKKVNKDVFFAINERKKKIVMKETNKRP